MADISPGPENDYQATPTLTFSREVWNVVMASISARLKARELLEATFEAMIEDGTQAALDLISTNVAPQLSELSTQITSLQGQLEDLLDAGTAPNALKLAGEDPAFYLSLANATGTLPVAKVEGIDASIATAIDALTDGAPSALDTLKEFSDALGNDADFAGTMMAALAARLVKANNLSDLPDVAEARDNLDLGDAATKDVATKTALLSNTGNSLLSTDVAWEATTWKAQSVSGSVTLDCATANNFWLTLTGNVTIDLVNHKPGQPIVIAFQQDGTGGRTVGFSSKFLFPNQTVPAFGTSATGVSGVVSLIPSQSGSYVLASGWKVHT
ncbi:phage tail protein [Afipia carboxidovorans]|uniref:phage tail protein n=1 Tax=Afipia carboxidovorans TaxID=40137 RepID=UPI003086432D|nr:hypothetical protein CRBSH125_08630 [Afipia carboxidovorans]